MKAIVLVLSLTLAPSVYAEDLCSGFTMYQPGTQDIAEGVEILGIQAVEEACKLRSIVKLGANEYLYVTGFDLKRSSIRYDVMDFSDDPVSVRTCSISTKNLNRGTVPVCTPKQEAR